MRTSSKGLLAALLVGASLVASGASAVDNVGPWQPTPVAGIPFFAGAKIGAVFPGLTSSISQTYTADTWHHADAFCTNAFGSVIVADAWRYSALPFSRASNANCPGGRLNTFGRVHLWT